MLPDAASADALEWLLGPEHPPAIFARDTWERRPLLVRRSADRSHFDRLGSGSACDPSRVPLRDVGQPSRLFSHARLRRLLQEHGPLPAGSSMRVVRCAIGGQGGRSEAHPPAGGYSAAWVSEQLKAGYTVQLFRPQVYCDRLWTLLAALECRFGALCGASVYLTPAGSQGLAPHHDDVEVFILQTEGRKTWAVYAPEPGNELPHRPSGDLPRSRLGRRVLRATLRPGDLLYLPRGFVHEAACSDKHRSTHITVSTYQRQTYADVLAPLLHSLLGTATEGRGSLSRQLRAGLPLGCLLTPPPEEEAADAPWGGARGSGEVGEVVARSLRALLRRATPAAIEEATEELATDFYCNRLPPPALAPPPHGPPPAGGSRTLLRLCDPAHRRLVRGGGFVQLQHCVGNAREDHMRLTFPPEAAPALLQLTASYPQWLAREDVVEGSSAVVEQMLAGCWAEGVLETRAEPHPPLTSRGAGKKKRARGSGGTMRVAHDKRARPALTNAPRD
ncbi:hypothetical protein EMIHUDRAFT_204434 [Emiliania huxleyi CCMP1516]|uniref:Bifunctional lysine-specific demethylase and histidyl-hydroxylase n=2 Tax=Emiliania huxleyi TaxID=2903 RepID=A0A0D3JYE3_EMIH1|nr:hypothetical protein EMIHUDRAFT_204434 [Emiliania huxleyi CCMP1516]EOD28528.1 hypothetical protein EMIHUDRAFT_204434 [Emiliania huxleyi CCMP1516]|eukprot:XP_005780957.1 hypothetical protein EMIHUDRAFT_204434 [Emiliania huxleyi CCMP1516]